MVDQLSPVETCRACGTPLSQPGALINGVGQNGAAPQAALWQQAGQQPGAAYPGYDQYVAGQAWPQAAPLDPDRPRWGPWSGIGVWLFSVAATIAIPFIAMMIWVVVAQSRGLIPQGGIDQE